MQSTCRNGNGIKTDVQLLYKNGISLNHKELSDCQLISVSWVFFRLTLEEVVYMESVYIRDFVMTVANVVFNQVGEETVTLINIQCFCKGGLE